MYQNQGRGLCVGGDTLIFSSFHGKITIFPPTHNLRTWTIFTVSVFELCFEKQNGKIQSTLVI